MSGSGAGTICRHVFANTHGAVTCKRLALRSLDSAPTGGDKRLAFGTCCSKCDASVSNPASTDRHRWLLMFLFQTILSWWCVVGGGDCNMLRTHAVPFWCRTQDTGGNHLRQFCRKEVTILCFCVNWPQAIDSARSVGPNTCAANGSSVVLCKRAEAEAWVIRGGFFISFN